MKRAIVAIFTIVMLLAAMPLAVVGADKSRSQNIIYVSGERYWLHTVTTGETLYSLSKLYDVSERAILDENPIIRSGFNVGLNVKIPYSVEEVKQISDKKLRKSFDIHTVGQGETLYSISRHYSISVEMIMEDNPNLDPTNITIGERLNIRKSEQGQTDERQIVAEINDYREQLNKVIEEEGFVYHLVEEGDTLESLMEEFDMEEGEIEQINKLPKGRALVVGQLILVNDTDLISRNRSYSSKIFSPLSWNETLKISLLLPLSFRGSAMTPMFELYQGFLLGLEDLKRKGRSVEVNLFNTEVSISTVEQIITSDEYRSSNLVVGPIFEDLLSVVLKDAEQRGVPVVSPMTNRRQQLDQPLDSEVLFRMDPTSTHLYNKLEGLLGDDYRVVLIYGESNSAEYASQIESIMERREKVYHRYYYKYEHPSVIAEREKMAEARYKQAEEEAEIMGFDELDEWALDTLYLAPSPSDLSPLILGTIFDIDSLKVSYEPEPSILAIDSLAIDTLAVDSLAIDSLMVDSLSVAVEERPRPTTLFFILSDRETEVDRVLSALASAYTMNASKLRGSGRRASTEFSYQVVANPEWSSYNNIDRTLYFRNRVVDFSSKLTGRDSEAVRDFDSRYSEAYDNFPSFYSYRGYDAAMIFAEGMYGDIQYNMEGRTYRPLQSEYRFEQTDSMQRRVNTNWGRVTYTPSFLRKIE